MAAFLFSMILVWGDSEGVWKPTVVFAALVEIDDSGFYRFIGAVAVANVLVALLQPILRRAAGSWTRQGVQVVFRLDREPSEEAVAAAAVALERHGVGVEEVVGPRV